MRKDRAGPLIPVLCALVESFARTGNFAKGRVGGDRAGAEIAPPWTAGSL